MGNERVVITGIGVIAPNGTGRDDFWKALKSGRSGIKEIGLFDASTFPTRIAGEVKDFQPADYMDAKKARRMARFSQFAVASTLMALGDASLQKKDLEKRDAMILLGVSTSAMDLIESQHNVFLEKGYRHILPFGIISATPNVGTGEVISALGVEAEMLTVATGCASGLDALGLGFRQIRGGSKKIVLAGGADAPITPLILGGLCASRIMSVRNSEPEKASRPFDRMRDGGVLSEGGAVVVMEELLSAVSRGARIYGEVIGYGEAAGENPGRGFKSAMLKAVYDADISFGSIDYISAHAPSDVFLDKEETRVIKEIFGKAAYMIPVSSIKSMVGNPFGSAGVLQAVGGLMAINEGIIPPTVNYEFPDPECDLDYVPNRARHGNIDTVLINSHGFGGANSALLIRKYR